MVFAFGLNCGRSPRRPPSVHAVDVGVDGAVQKPDRVLASVARQVAVVAVDHQEASAHVARELEGRDPGPKREGGKRVAQVIDPPQRFDASLELRRFPVAVSEVAKVEIAAARRREEEPRLRVAR